MDHIRLVSAMICVVMAAPLAVPTAEAEPSLESTCSDPAWRRSAGVSGDQQCGGDRPPLALLPAGSWQVGRNAWIAPLPYDPTLSEVRTQLPVEQTFVGRRWINELTYVDDPEHHSFRWWDPSTGEVWAVHVIGDGSATTLVTIGDETY